MDYYHINNFLDKFKKILAVKEAPYDVVIAVIKENLGLKIERSNVKIKGNTIYIQSSPLVKNEILIKKSFILNDLSKITGQSFLSEIK